MILDQFLRVGCAKAICKLMSNIVFCNQARLIWKGLAHKNDRPDVLWPPCKERSRSIPLHYNRRSTGVPSLCVYLRVYYVAVSVCVSASVLCV